MVCAGRDSLCADGVHSESGQFLLPDSVQEVAKEMSDLLGRGFESPPQLLHQASLTFFIVIEQKENKWMASCRGFKRIWESHFVVPVTAGVQRKNFCHLQCHHHKTETQKRLSVMCKTSVEVEVALHFDESSLMVQLSSAQLSIDGFQARLPGGPWGQCSSVACSPQMQQKPTGIKRQNGSLLFIFSDG